MNDNTNASGPFIQDGVWIGHGVGSTHPTSDTGAYDYAATVADEIAARGSTSNQDPICGHFEEDVEGCDGCYAAERDGELIAGIVYARNVAEGRWAWLDDGSMFGRIVPGPNFHTPPQTFQAAAFDEYLERKQPGAREAAQAAVRLREALDEAEQGRH